ncbi:HpcH/HpaI aldolase/citrate lyase family protein [Variovorax sp. GB1P17]|uniref:HpcH/HpaI aldolase/citrate lyase family protein n=1 Tax=Variovorax sp. GB1P17 TaxID=3443740 RepID=UPI003F46D0DD
MKLDQPHKRERTLLAAPATTARYLEKAAQSSADAVFLDLEDAVAPEFKQQARALAIQALNGLDWGARKVAVRVNGLDTSWGCREILDLVESCPRLDSILVPKCSSADDVRAAEVLLRAAEKASGRERPVRIDALIETARGLAHVEDIAGASERLCSLVFGAGDYQRDLGKFQRVVGAPSADYAVLTDAGADGHRQVHWNDQWHFAMARIANASRAYGLTPVDGPFTAIKDSEGLRAAARRALALGFAGKMAIHPDQLAAITEVFSPSAEQVTWAREVLQLTANAASAGKGAVKDARGDMIDIMHVNLANEILARVAA